jgi:hypothetical protein
MESILENKKTGGLLLKYAKHPDDIFNDFLKNSKNIQYVADGANGIIYKVVVPEKYESGYTYIDPNYYGEPVREIALKLCILKQSDISSFKSEVNIQNTIFQKSLDHLQPLCPAILYSTILRDSQKRGLVNQMIKIDPDVKTHKLPYLDSDVDIDGGLLTESKYLIGVIAMEFENGYKRLYDYVNSSKISREMKIKYIHYGLYIILKLAVETGYSQADFHTANIMIHPEMDYFGKNSGRPLILDFGYSRKISPKVMTKIKSLIKNGKYVDALKWICGVKRSDNATITKEAWSSYYGWVCRDWDLLNRKKGITRPTTIITVDDDNSYSIPKRIMHTNDSDIARLFGMREVYLRDLMKQFMDLNKKSPINYPKLPLSKDIIRNRTYIGLRGGRKPKNKTMKNRKW